MQLGALVLCVGSDKYLIWETQYLYWETLTTNEYHTQPQVRAAETARDAEQTIKVPVSHATNRVQCGNLRFLKCRGLQRGQW